uniref:Putative secreted protein n=1 Tax=Anopheles marajoara TaxID=58244 RepID=A0A2M4CBN5_9DIPT
MPVGSTSRGGAAYGWPPQSPHAALLCLIQLLAQPHLHTDQRTPNKSGRRALLTISCALLDRLPTGRRSALVATTTFRIT